MQVNDAWLATQRSSISFSPINLTSDDRTASLQPPWQNSRKPITTLEISSRLSSRLGGVLGQECTRAQSIELIRLRKRTPLPLFAAPALPLVVPALGISGEMGSSFTSAWFAVFAAFAAGGCAPPVSCSGDLQHKTKRGEYVWSAKASDTSENTRRATTQAGNQNSAKIILKGFAAK